MNIDRLNKLIAFMEALPPEKAEHFMMDSWVTHNGSSDVEGQHGIVAGKEIPETVLIECGMAACAFGWAATIPEFKEAGLGLTIEQSGSIATPCYRNRHAFEAAKEFFEISDELASDLFDSHTSIRSPQAWAKYARQLLADRD